MRISDWSSDVCSSDLVEAAGIGFGEVEHVVDQAEQVAAAVVYVPHVLAVARVAERPQRLLLQQLGESDDGIERRAQLVTHHRQRSEEHTSELQSLMRISYAVFCLKKKKKRT